MLSKSFHERARNRGASDREGQHCTVGTATCLDARWHNSPIIVCHTRQPFTIIAHRAVLPPPGRPRALRCPSAASNGRNIAQVNAHLGRRLAHRVHRVALQLVALCGTVGSHRIICAARRGVKMTVDNARERVGRHEFRHSAATNCEPRFGVHGCVEIPVRPTPCWPLGKTQRARTPSTR